MNYTGLKRTVPLAVFALLIYMPFHMILSRSLSLYTGGLMLWDVGKDIFTALVLAISLYVIYREKFYKNPYMAVLLTLSTVYALMHLVFLLSPLLDRHAVVMAMTYNGRLFAYLVISITAALSSDDTFLRRIMNVIIIISTLTAIFAIVQYILPKDLMTHFGYSIERGAKPNFFIDDKIQFPRIMSTLREPNSYGAFLIVPITALWLLLLENYKKSKFKMLLGLIVLHFIAFLMTFSRSAIIGLSISLLIATVVTFNEVLRSIIKKYRVFLLILLSLLMLVGFTIRSSSVVQNVVLHKDQTTIETDPNKKRILVQQRAIKEIINRPEGHSPGTAGPIAFENRKMIGIIPENYYLQIAYEIGILGLGVFLLLISITYTMINKAKNNTLKSVMIGSFWGYIFIALLTHIWANEAVSAQWWLLAGVLIGTSLKINKSKFKPKVIK